jgi:hypothetical protein
MIVTATQPTKIPTILPRTSTGCNHSNANANNNNTTKNGDNTVLATTVLTTLT